MKLEKAQRFPVLVCHNVIVDGKRAELPLVTFLMASRLRVARTFGVDVRRPELPVMSACKSAQADRRLPGQAR